MADWGLGTVVAERHFGARNVAGEEREVVLRIGAPIPDPRPGGDWCCPYQITGLPHNRASRAFGVDPLQAFLLALQKARAELVFSQRIHSLRLTWLEQHDWGFPVFQTDSGEVR